MLKSLLEDQCSRWQRGDRVQVAWYVERHPALFDDPLKLAALIQNEVSLRHARGEANALQVYLSAYPQCQSILAPQTTAFETLLPEGPGPAMGASFEPTSTTADASSHVDADATHWLADSVLPIKERSNFETVIGGGDVTHARFASEGARYPRVPGFEIQSELGRGGMGIVYRARQLSTRRTVALKIVRNDLLDTLAPSNRKATLERFHTEAQAAACLQHDNVVAVYEVGDVPSSTPGASPLHYYAMRFVQGESLFEVLRDGPLENRRAASYIQQVAKALQAAHEQGILHRDLKPHNIMVEAGTDRPLVTDFGLAKFVEGQNSITYAGQVMGTPAYMSPEQAQDAASVTASADQYSIGATLYHLLTGRPPFQAASISETIRQIIDKQPVAPKQLNTAVHRDLETICLKTIHKDPGRRYANCRELAEDLQRYLDGRPIFARPVGRLERTWRWCQRNPIPASLSAAAAILLMAFMASIVIGFRNTSAALAVSESRLERALQVVDELFTRVSEDELLNEPGMQPLREELLEKALKHYEYFLSESGSNQKLGEEVAAAHFRVGMIYQLTRKLNEAEKELKQAQSQQEDLQRIHQESADHLKSLADTYNALGSVYSKLQRLQESMQMLQKATEMRTKLVALDASNPEFQRLLSNATMNMGLVKIDNQLVEDGVNDMRHAQEMRLQLLAADPNSVRLQRDLAMGWYSLGKHEAELGQLDLAVDALDKSVVGFRKLAVLDPRSLNYRYSLGVALTLLGGIHSETGNAKNAVKAYEEALSPIQSLVSGNPDVPDYKAALIDVSMRLGIEYSMSEELEKSAEARKQALSLSRDIADKEPNNPDTQADIAYCLGSLGDLERRMERPDEAIAYYEEANALLKQMLEQYPNRTSFQDQLDQNEEELQAIRRP